MNTPDARTPGRPPKGPRHRRTIRFPIRVDAALQRAAAARGMNVQDYLDQLVENDVKAFMEDEDESMSA